MIAVSRNEKQKAIAFCFFEIFERENFCEKENSKGRKSVRLYRQ